MATERKSITELLRLAAALPVSEQLELIARLSTRLAGEKPVRVQKKTWMEMAGLGAEIWKDVDAQEYVCRERASWEN
ncbi:MAG: hypothetical protein QMC81_11105 [Thermoanaerobacterales bacterium]|nr:hypothetical protein [Thermoanaerobacterales bacterium]